MNTHGADVRANMVREDLTKVKAQLAIDAFSGHQLLANQARATGDMPLATLLLTTASLGTYRPGELVPVAVGLELLRFAADAHYYSEGIARENTRNLYLVSADYYYAQAIRVASRLNDGKTIERMVQAIADIAGRHARGQGSNGAAADTGKHAGLFTAAITIGVTVSGCPDRVIPSLRRFAAALSRIYEVIHERGDGRPMHGQALEGMRKSALLAVEPIPSPQSFLLTALLS